MAYWKIPVIKTEYSFIIVESEVEPSEYEIEQACMELEDYDWTDVEYEAEDDPFEVEESYANEYNIFRG